MNYARFLNAVSRARRPSPLRGLTEILQQSPPGTISMATGLPNVEQFPFREATFQLMDRTNMHLNASEMKKALQYTATPGLPELRDWLIDMQMKIHNPPTLDSSNEDSQMDLIVSTGSQHALSTSCEMLLAKGDNVLTSSPLYPGTVAILRPLGVEFLTIKVDGDGMVPDRIREVMSQWDPEEGQSESSDIPRVLCVVPNGDNPSGAGLTLERKKDIYSIAQKYNMIIMEDDPYYFIQFNKPKVPSFLSMDVDGRVLRFDSFSKILSAGMRVGFLTGPKYLLQRVNMHMQASVLHTGGMAQMLIFKLLEQWGMEGFLNHTDKVAAFYEERRDMIMESADRWLRGLAQWHKPRGGMFLWLKLLGIRDTTDLIMKKARHKGVLFVPGSVFYPESDRISSHLRAAYSLCTPEQMDQGMQRLAALVKEEMAE
ncbi:kynurenine/alpha-aminoadipate aminotransferase, mitochondrial-like [Acanthaster planci]|uniref:Kynurenine/alpha-aminoadipate aminotransferase, mitochondrial n=1 Tax=Acanthaster planci TaxID=133434 RepID=A0A8B7XX62_ACAPL|nr:kynurenine/alpha-aminoadipate aminotransferase, mitochondrial-like [Acanthaster planci]